MQCPKCNSFVEDGLNNCPSCGNQLNSTQENVNNDDEVVMITENMAPPELVVSKENMAKGAGDLSSAANVSSYNPEETENKTREDNKPIIQDRVDFSIPKVSAPVVDENQVLDGNVPVIGNQDSTVGEENSEEKNNNNIKIGGKVLKVKMGKSLSMPLVIIVAILTLVIGIFIGKSLFSKNYCSTSKSTSTQNKTTLVSDGKNNITNVGSYTYKIPSNYIYDKDSNGLKVYDESGTFRIYIKTLNGSYEDMSGAKLSIKETLKDNNTTVNNIRELNISNSDFLIIETNYKTINRLVAFADASNDYVYYIEIVTTDNNYDYDVLNIAADIVTNATYQERSSTIESIDINDISSLSVKASLEYKALTNN
jgi:uncharacterized Zn finger protein (UPF0148 family)